MSTIGKEIFAKENENDPDDGADVEWHKQGG